MWSRSHRAQEACAVGQRALTTNYERREQAAVERVGQSAGAGCASRARRSSRVAASVERKDAPPPRSSARPPGSAFHPPRRLEQAPGLERAGAEDHRQAGATGERVGVGAAESARSRRGEHGAAARDTRDQREVWARPSSRPSSALACSSVRVPSADASVGERHRRAPEEQTGDDRGGSAEAALERLLKGVADEGRRYEGERDRAALGGWKSPPVPWLSLGSLLRRMISSASVPGAAERVARRTAPRAGCDSTERRSTSSAAAVPAWSATSKDLRSSGSSSA